MFLGAVVSRFVPAFTMPLISFEDDDDDDDELLQPQDNDDDECNGSTSPAAAVDVGEPLRLLSHQRRQLWGDGIASGTWPSPVIVCKDYTYCTKLL